MEPIVLGPQDSKHGAVETREDAKKCAALFQANRDKIDGIIVSLPNFGDERAVAETLRLAGLNVPVLIQATPDSASKMSIKFRRDSFCGKMSVCNNLTPVRHSVFADHAAYRSSRFRSLPPGSGLVRRRLPRRQRAAQGAHRRHRRAARRHSIPCATARNCWKRAGITIEPVDLSEILGRVARMADTSDPAQQKLAAIKSYVPTDGIAPEALLKMAKLAAVVDGWMKETDVAISAVQCWTAMEEYFGVVPCTMMSMMSNEPDAERLRGGYLRHGRHVRAAAGLGHAQRAARLEQ